MRTALLLTTVFALSACASGSQDSSTPSSQNETPDIDELASELDYQIARGWEGAMAAMQEDVRRCGTSVVVLDEPVIFNDQFYLFWIAPSATSDQIACAQRIYPDLKVAPK